MTFRIGQVVGVPCQIQAGAFSNEYLVSISTEHGILSGFADSEDVHVDPKNPNRGMIRAQVEEIGSDKVKLRIYGSFFTIASGTTHFSSGWADRYLQEVTA